MQKKVLYALLLLLSVSLLALLLIKSPITGNIVFTELEPRTCSNEHVRTMWDAMFIESSANILIYLNGSGSGTSCLGYFAYKVQDDQIFMLEWKQNGSQPSRITATQGTYNTQQIAIVQNITSIGNTTGLIESTNSVQERNPSVLNAEAANVIFDSLFETNTSSWIITSGNYQYNYPIPATAQNWTLKGLVMNSSNYSRLDYIEPSSCIATWQQTNTSCGQNDRFTIDYVKTNTCLVETNRPASIIGWCDYDKNGIIGNYTDFPESNIKLTLYIDDSQINTSRNYTVPSKVELREKNVSRISFTHNFTTPLSFTNLSIKKQTTNASYGYLIVEGLTLEKTLTIDKINPASTQVCVKNSNVKLITELSTMCNGLGEALLSCPGTQGAYSCTSTNTTLIVSGLTSSAVKEMTTLGSCTPTWSCTSWDSCLGGVRTRTCTDINACDDLTDQPLEVEICEVTTQNNGCTPNWSCGNWTPTTCPKNQTQIRTCTDLARCNLETSKPATSQTCVYEKKENTFIMILIVILTIIMLVIAGVIFYVLEKRKRENAGNTFAQQDNIPPLIPPQ